MNKLATAILEALRNGHRVQFRLEYRDDVAVIVTSTTERGDADESKRESESRKRMIREEIADDVLAAAVWRASEGLPTR